MAKTPGQRAYENAVIDLSTQIDNILSQEDYGEAIESKDIDELTSSHLEHIRQKILDAFKEKEVLHRRIQSQIKYKKWLTGRYFGILHIWYSVTGNAEYKRLLHKANIAISDAQKKYRNFHLKLNLVLKEPLLSYYHRMFGAFQDVCNCDVWDAVEKRGSQRIQAENGIYNVKFFNQTSVRFCESGIDFLECPFSAMYMENANGPDIYIYPNFVILYQPDSFSSKNLAIIDIRNVRVSGHEVICMDRELPDGYEFVDQKWAYANKNGAPDQRRKVNEALPLFRCFQLNITSESGLNESYILSNCNLGKSFVEQFRLYQEAVK